MNQNFLRLIRSGATAEIADAVKSDLLLARWRDPQGVSALMWSIYSGQTMVRDFLRAALTEQSIPLNIFEAAALGDNARLAELLLQDPRLARARSGDGWTPLHLAAAFGTPVCVATLLRAGADVNATSANAQANQPLHAALALGRDPETTQLLLDHGADPNAIQVGGFTPLFSAATVNRRDLAKLLLDHGAHAHQLCDSGKTPADFARDRGHTELADWLEAHSG